MTLITSVPAHGAPAPRFPAGRARGAGVGVKKARFLDCQEGSAKVAFSPPAPLARAGLGLSSGWGVGGGGCTRAHRGQDRVSGEPGMGPRVALVLDFQGYSLSRVSRGSPGDVRRGLGHVPPWCGAPGGFGCLSHPPVLCWGLSADESPRGGGSLSSCLVRVRLPAGQGSAVSWASPVTGGLEHPLVAPSKAGRAFLPEAPSQHWGWGVGELEGGADGGGDPSCPSTRRRTPLPQARGRCLFPLWWRRGHGGHGREERSGALGGGGARAVSARTPGSVFPVSPPPPQG